MASRAGWHRDPRLWLEAFVLVNLARFVKVDPEQALRRTNTKFRERFGYIERKLAERGKKLEESNIAEMEALWQEAKR